MLVNNNDVADDAADACSTHDCVAATELSSPLVSAKQLCALVSADDGSCPRGVASLRVAAALATVMSSRTWTSLQGPDCPAGITAAAACVLAVWGCEDDVRLVQSLKPERVIAQFLAYLRCPIVTSECIDLGDAMPFGAEWATAFWRSVRIARPSPPQHALLDENDNFEAVAQVTGDDDDDHNDDVNDEDCNDTEIFAPATQTCLHALEPSDVWPYLDASSLVEMATFHCWTIGAAALPGKHDRRPIHEYWNAGARMANHRPEPARARVIGKRTTAARCTAALSTARVLFSR